MTLRLRPYVEADEAAAVAIHEAMLADIFPFLLDWEGCCRGRRSCESNEEQRQGLNPSTYRVRGVQLGASWTASSWGARRLRFELNEFFAERGGHVGYGVAPPQRRKGYATEILRQSLIVILRAEGVERVLVTCGDDNVASARTIEKNGGVLRVDLFPLEDEDPVETASLLDRVN
jgi:predicted acetyltransferase